MPALSKKPIRDRILERCVSAPGPLDTPCLVWTGGLSGGKKDGYGVISWNGKPHCTHRVLMLLKNPDLTAEQHTDHRCRNRKCNNEDHLEIVSFAENKQRGLLGVLRVEQKYCKRGHLFTGARNSTTGHQFCIKCKEINKLAREEKRQGGRNQNYRSTRCKVGHELTEDNTGTNKEGYRWCRECARLKARKRKGSIREYRKKDRSAPI